MLSLVELNIFVNKIESKEQRGREQGTRDFKDRPLFPVPCPSVACSLFPVLYFSSNTNNFVDYMPHHLYESQNASVVQ